MNISLIVPIYNEEEVLGKFYRTVIKDNFLKSINIEVLFVNDGSTDQSRTIVEEYIQKDNRIKLINFSRHFGKEPALLCGLEHCSGEVAVPIDVDLQDPIELIGEMFKIWKGGADVVLAKRNDRSNDAFMKRVTANLFYKIHNTFSYSKIEENVGDFRMMDRKVVDVVTQLKESNLFMKGLLSWPGFKTEIIEYKRSIRAAGSTNFNAIKLFNLAIEGITSFSIAPLKMATHLGFGVSFFAFLYGAHIISKTLFFGVDLPGYASLMTVILFIGGIQLIAIGILGEYVGRIYSEVKMRPRYIIESVVNDEVLTQSKTGTNPSSNPNRN